jgi:predicted HTH domain antitoxin
MTPSTITIELPQEIEQQLEEAWGNGALARHILEAVAVEGYRTEALSAGQVAELLGLSGWETDTFLKEHGAYLHYTEEDLERDRQTLAELLDR